MKVIRKKLLLGPTSNRRLDPLQRTFSPDPDEPDDQDEQENQHLHQSKKTQSLELHCPGEEEDSLHVEDDKQDSNDVITDGIASTRAVDRVDAALVGHQLGLTGIVGPHQFGSQER